VVPNDAVTIGESGPPHQGQVVVEPAASAVHGRIVVPAD